MERELNPNELGMLDYSQQLKALAVQMETESGIASMQFDGAEESRFLSRYARKVRTLAFELAPQEAY